MRRAVAFSSSRRTPGVWVADGDSRMAEFTGTLLAGQDLPAVTAPLLNGNWTYYNAALAGQQLGGASPSAPGARQATIPETDIETRPRVWANRKVVRTAHWGSGNGARNVISCQGILNDILTGHCDFDACVARILTWRAAKLAAGFNRIVFCTELAYVPTDLATNLVLDAVNDWHRTRWRSYFHALADLRSIPAAQDASNATYFQEAPNGVHGTAALNQLLKVELARAINEAIGLPDPPS
jgi:hypothetical protein